MSSKIVGKKLNKKSHFHSLSKLQTTIFWLHNIIRMNNVVLFNNSECIPTSVNGLTSPFTHGGTNSGSESVSNKF